MKHFNNSKQNIIIGILREKPQGTVALMTLLEYHLRFWFYIIVGIELDTIFMLIIIKY